MFTVGDQGTEGPKGDKIFVIVQIFQGDGVEAALDQTALDLLQNRPDFVWGLALIVGGVNLGPLLHQGNAALQAVPCGGHVEGCDAV